MKKKKVLESSSAILTWPQIIASDYLHNCFGTPSLSYIEPNYFMMHNISEVMNGS